MPEVRSKPARRGPLLLGLGLAAVLSLAVFWSFYGRPLPWQDGPGQNEDRLAIHTDAALPEAESGQGQTESLPELAQRAESDGDPDAEAAAPAATIDRRSPTQRPTTVVSRPAPQRAIDVPRPPIERERVVASAAEAQRLIEEARLDVQPPQRSTPTEVPQFAPPESFGPPEPAPESVPKSVPEPWSPERTEFMRQWELPLAVRRDLPSLSLSIHVFSAEPASRFVLINGERRMEGDDLGQGAQLLEIRREGALVQFRDFRFLLEP